MNMNVVPPPVSRRIEVTEVLTEAHAVMVMLLAKEMWQEIKPVQQFQPHVMVEYAQRLLADADRASDNVWVAIKQGKPIGFGLAFMSRHFFSAEPYASLVYWYTVPAQRKTAAPYLIYKAFEHWAKINGAVETVVGAVNQHDPDVANGLNNMFRKRGYKEVGHWYSKPTVEG